MHPRHFARGRQRAWRLLESGLVRPGQYVLDYGAGPGHLALPLEEAGVRVLCAEANPNICARLRELGLTVVQSIDGAVPERGFDVALAFSVLHHNPPGLARTIVANIAARLKPGGALLFTYSQQPRPAGFPRPVQAGIASVIGHVGTDVAEVGGMKWLLDHAGVAPETLRREPLFQNCYQVSAR